MGPPGHFGIAFAAKPAAPKVPLLILLVASEALDILSFVFFTLGLETFGVTEVSLSQGLTVVVPSSIPWSHGLLMSIIWSLLFAAIAFLISKDTRTAGVIGLVVFSHWVLDFIVHAPDLPLLFANSPKLGLGLWASGPGLITSFLLELALLLGGFIIYYTARKRKRLPSPEIVRG